MADLTFYSSIRQGAALAIARTEVATSQDVIPHVQLPVTLGYQATSGETADRADLGKTPVPRIQESEYAKSRGRYRDDQATVGREGRAVGVTHG